MMMELMNRITDKKDWNSKIFDNSIISKWRTEALAMVAPDTDFSEKMVDYVGTRSLISELSSRRRLSLSRGSSV